MEKSDALPVAENSNFGNTQIRVSPSETAAQIPPGDERTWSRSETRRRQFLLLLGEERN